MIDSLQTSPPRARHAFGWLLLVASLIPWVAAPFVPLLGLPTEKLGGVIASLLIGGEILGVMAISVLGKDAYSRLTRRFRRSKKSTPNASQRTADRVLEQET